MSDIVWYLSFSEEDLCLVTVLSGSEFSNISEKAKTGHPSIRDDIEGGRYLSETGTTSEVR